MKEITNYQLSTSVSDGILEIIITGELTKNTIDSLHAEVITIIRKEKVKAVLCDVRAAKGPNDITAAYFRSRNIPPDVIKLPSAAVVELSANIEFTSFYETTAANAGHLAKFFTNIEAARAWLKSRP